MGVGVAAADSWRGTWLGRPGMVLFVIVVFFNDVDVDWLTYFGFLMRVL